MKSSYWFSLALPVATQISGIALLTVLPFSTLFSGKTAIFEALNNALIFALVFWPASLGLFLISIPFGLVQVKCARSLARQNVNTLSRFSVGLLNFSIAVLLIAGILAWRAFHLH